MYTFDLSQKFLTSEEQALFNEFLTHHQLDSNIWEVFACLFRSGISNTIPIMLRVYDSNGLCGAVVLIRCRKYGRALFRHKIPALAFDLAGIPFYLWIRFGCCMDMMSNPGFVRDPGRSDEICSAMANYLKKISILTVINDYTIHGKLFAGSSILPSLPHALIDTSGMNDISDYIRDHKNIKTKIKRFRKMGGTIDRLHGILPEKDLDSLRECFIATSENSTVYLPYQDLYLKSALETAGTRLNNVIYFVARLNGEFLGYQSAIHSGKCLNALHGAFDRRRSSTHHAYDLIFIEMTNYAIEHHLVSVDYGAVLNITKQRMVNKTVDMAYFLLSKFRIIQFAFQWMLKITRIQSHEQLQFREDKKL